MAADQAVTFPAEHAWGTSLHAGGAPASARGLTNGWLASRPRPVLIAIAAVMVAVAAGALAPVKPLDAVAVLVGAVIVAAVLIRPVVGAVLLVSAVPLTSGLAPGLPVAHVRVSEILIALVAVTLVLFAQRRHAVPWGTLDWVLLAYGLCWAALGVFASVSLGQHLTLDDWGTVAGQLQFILVYRGVRIAVHSRAERRIVVGAAILGCTPMAVLAILQEIRTPGVASLIVRLTGGVTAGSIQSTGSLLRATGAFQNWASLAGYLLPIVLVLVALAVARIEVRARRWFVAAGLLAAIALAFTVEQSVIICVLVGVAVIVRRLDESGRLSRWVLAGLVVVAAVAAPLVVERIVSELGTSAGTGEVGWIPHTLSFRWSVWTKEYLPAIGARPLSGYGVVLPSSIQWAFPESQYVALLIEGGIPMLVMFGVLVWAMLRATASAARSTDPLDRALGLALSAAVVSMLVVNVVWPFMSNAGLPQVLWGLMAVTVPYGARAATSMRAGWTTAGTDPGAGDSLVQGALS